MIMRIDMVSEHASPLATLGGVDAGGQNVHVAALARALARLGHIVTVHTRRDDPSLPARVPVDGYEVHHLDAGPARPVPKDDLVGLVPAMAAHLAREWRINPPDVVHAHFWMSGLAALRARDVAGLGSPLALTFHALGSIKRAHLGGEDTSPQDRIDRERDLARAVDVVVATASEEAAHVRSWGVPGFQVEVVPCGVELELFDPFVPLPGTRRIVSLGRLVPRKGVGDLITALSGVPGAELVVAGGPAAADLDEDGEVARLRALAEADGVDDRVRFVGAVRRRDVPALLASADVVACLPWYEPFGIVPLEAMAAGRPLVASAVGGIRDSVVGRGIGRTGVLVPPRSPRRVTVALNRVLDDPAFAARLGRAGAERTGARYGWDSIAARTLDAYDRALVRTSMQPRSGGAAASLTRALAS